MISTQVNPDTKVALAGARPSTKRDAAWLLDQAYAVAGTGGNSVFRPSRLNDEGLWPTVLHKDRFLRDEARESTVVAWYKKWLPPWQRAPTPAPAASSSQPSRKRSRS